MKNKTILEGVLMMLPMKLLSLIIFILSLTGCQKTEPIYLKRGDVLLCGNSVNYRKHEVEIYQVVKGAVRISRDNDLVADWYDLGYVRRHCIYGYYDKEIGQ